LVKIFLGPLQDCIEFCFSRDSIKCRCFGQLEFEDFYFNFQGGIGFCGKDTGGPLMCNSHLCGVISFSQGCAQSGYPGVYTKVDPYIDWINEPTGSATSNRNSFFSVMAMGIVAKFYF
jgi:hypothetical protein